MAHEERDVQAELDPLDRIEVVAERFPVRHEAQRLEVRREAGQRPLVERRERVAAVARELGRVALVEVAGEGPVDEQRPVRVPVRIDEARRHDEPRDVEDERDIALRDGGQVAHRGDPVAEHADVGRAAGAPEPSTSDPPRSTRSKAMDRS